jgi:predicted ATP-binding protein involved in virulence
MRITKLTLQNFRNFDGDAEKNTFHFPEKFTAIIGVNGKGKSSLLNGLEIAAGSYLLGISEAAKRHIRDNEIRKEEVELTEGYKHLVPKVPVNVIAEGYIENEKLLIWRRCIPDVGAKTTSSYAHVGSVRDIAEQKRKKLYEDNEPVDNPVILFFGSARIWGAARKTKALAGHEIFSLGYESWSDMRSSSFRYTDWLGGYDYRLKDQREVAGSKEAFFQTIKAAIPFIREIDFGGKELWLKLENGDAYLPLSLHSDGIQTMVNIVAELTFRCIILNGHHGVQAVIKSKGLVMMDEIDIHIHPNWQRHLVHDLKNAFPEIQFVVTTHSPFIIQSLSGNEIINLDFPDSDLSPIELPIDDVAEDVMGVSSSFSLESEQKENLSDQYLQILNQAVVESGSGNIDKLSQQLDEIENQITDPGLRSFLRMNRIAKNK